MRYVCLFWILLLGLRASVVKAHSPAVPTGPTAPRKAQFYTQDVTNSWPAYDAWRAGQPGNPFAKLYVKLASAVAKIRLEKNGLAHPNSLLWVVPRRSADYERIRAACLRMVETIPQCRKHYAVLKKIHPAAVFPPVYFAIGGFVVSGNSVLLGQLIRAEMYEPANIPPMVAHELIHAQQRIPYKNQILLGQIIIEGSADFLAEMIPGKAAGSAAYNWARDREKELWQEFERDQSLGENHGFAMWLYAGERPADLGYAIGYQVTKAYYDRAADKRQAVYDILNIKDCREFLRQSGYAA